MTLVAERWTPSGLDPADRVDAFREAISATHLPWSLDAPVDGPPDPMSSPGTGSRDLTLIDCRCGPCSGSRGRSQLAATSDDVVGVLFVRSGVEYVETGESRSVVRPGAALLWRGDEPVRFALPGRLHKWTLLVPPPVCRTSGAARSTRRLQRCWRPSWGRRSRLRGRCRGGSGQPVADAAVELLRGAVAPSSSDDATWLRVTAFVQRHLREPSLAPPAIAAGTFVSVRALYALFAARGTSPAAYVRSLRLEAACRDLARRGTAVTVAEVAHGWGFATRRRSAAVSARRSGGRRTRCAVRFRRPARLRRLLQEARTALHGDEQDRGRDGGGADHQADGELLVEDQHAVEGGEDQHGEDVAADDAGVAALEQRELQQVAAGQRGPPGRGSRRPARPVQCTGSSAVVANQIRGTEP